MTSNNRFDGCKASMAANTRPSCVTIKSAGNWSAGQSTLQYGKQRTRVGITTSGIFVVKHKLGPHLK